MTERACLYCVFVGVGSESFFVWGSGDVVGSSCLRRFWGERCYCDTAIKEAIPSPAGGMDVIVGRDVKFLLLTDALVGANASCVCMYGRDLAQLM